MFIFLDIDGVMVPVKSWVQPALLSDGFPAFSNGAVATLRSIISGDATIVLTTSHKENFSLNQWRQIFANRGIDAENIQTLEPNSDRLSRKEEIEKWFLKNDLSDSFVIIDDDKSLNDLPVYLKSHLVLTNSMVGLTEEHVAAIRRVEQISYTIA